MLRKLKMHSTFPAAVPEIPVGDIDKAAEYYEKNLGFKLDWGGEAGGIAGISKGHCRMFLTNPAFRDGYGNAGPVLIWLNLNSKAEVRELYEQWKATQARLISEPEEKPWNLIEFTAADLDGNLFRVFYDFSRDVTP
jgi:predicted lactoylglutathione lyase